MVKRGEHNSSFNQIIRACHGLSAGGSKTLHVEVRTVDDLPRLVQELEEHLGRSKNGQDIKIEPLGVDTLRIFRRRK